MYWAAIKATRVWRNFFGSVATAMNLARLAGLHLYSTEHVARVGGTSIDVHDEQFEDWPTQFSAGFAKFAEAYFTTWFSTGDVLVAEAASPK